MSDDDRHGLQFGAGRELRAMSREQNLNLLTGRTVRSFGFTRLSASTSMKSA